MDKPTSEKRPFFLKQWRKHRGYTQERLAEMIGMAPGYLVDLENRKRRFNEDHLDVLAEALTCSPADLLMRDPTKEDALHSVWDNASPAERRQAVAFLQAVKGTGTGG